MEIRSNERSGTSLIPPLIFLFPLSCYKVINEASEVEWINLRNQRFEQVAGSSLIHLTLNSLSLQNLRRDVLPGLY